MALAGAREGCQLIFPGDSVLQGIRSRQHVHFRILPFQQLSHTLAVSAPLLDLVEIAMVRDQGLVSFFVGLVAHAARATTSRLRTNCSTSRLRRSRSTSISCDAGIKWPGYIASRSGSRLGKRRSFVP